MYISESLYKVTTSTNSFIVVREFRFCFTSNRTNGKKIVANPTVPAACIIVSPAMLCCSMLQCVAASCSVHYRMHRRLIWNVV